MLDYKGSNIFLKCKTISKKICKGSVKKQVQHYKQIYDTQCV